MYAKLSVDDFTVGYAVHILGDVFWTHGGPYQLFHARYAADENPAQDRRSALYNDTDQLDFALYHHMNWRAEVFDCLERAAAQGLDELVSKDEVERWNLRTMGWFDDASKYTLPVRYFSEQELLDFIISAGQRTAAFLREIHETNIFHASL